MDQFTGGGISEPDPNHLRACAPSAHPFGIIFTFGDHNGCVRCGILPNRSVLALCKPDLQHVFGFVSLPAQPIGEPFWKLIIYQETHWL